MISGNLTNLTKVCKDFTKVENYDEAVKSDKMYVLHHCAEFRYTSEELKAMGKYYDRPPNELIFIPASLHLSCVELHIGRVKPKRKQLSERAIAEINFDEWQNEMLHEFVDRLKLQLKDEKLESQYEKIRQQLKKATKLLDAC